MIDVFEAASGMLGDVNPMQDAVLRVSDGVAIAEDYSATSTYRDIPVHIEVQALAGGDLQLLENIEQQADMRTVYMRGAVHALNRPLDTGGDLLLFNGGIWRVTQVLEQWGGDDWCKIAVTRQIKDGQTSN
ncbi:hypothetical protein [Bombella saccharophila]|uniref:Uncharacterized protein n=1 Tax=Bombella saccharophila TaxID=2967338 RepID=A0ABT3W5U1_9PROT|nr:hypothetical protein [Bombella saccharophila]MCX5614436.1 hypothetical protein [Bombella saccharophila]